jgi:hypothetical protein
VDGVRITHAYLRYRKYFTKTQFDIMLTIQYNNAYVSRPMVLLELEIQFNFALMQQMSASVTAAALHDRIGLSASLSILRISAGYVNGMGEVASVAFAPLVKAEKESEWVKY